MWVQSRAYRTDLLFAAYDGEIVDRGDYLVVRTPGNPGYYWGNYLLFRAPPDAGALQAWPALMAREHPEAEHMAFGWDAVDGAVGDAAGFVARGFQLVDDEVLVLSVPPAAHAVPGLELRPLASEADWRAMVALNQTVSEPAGDPAAFAQFLERLMVRYRAMVEDGRGVWLGGFFGDVLVGHLGLFLDGERARFQTVETHPDFRRRGVCTALVRHACRLGLAELGARELIIVAEPDEPPGRLYRRVGFRPVERQVGVFRASG